jgi:quercetin dioxygenase-like cupin family protein
MKAAEFSNALRKEGFLTLVEVEREPNGGIDLHVHPFQSKALILEGELSLVVDGVETLYRAGDVFELSFDQQHVERYGPKGVKYLVGRR